MSKFIFFLSFFLFVSTFILAQEKADYQPRQSVLFFHWQNPILLREMICQVTFRGEIRIQNVLFKRSGRFLDKITITHFLHPTPKSIEISEAELLRYIDELEQSAKISQTNSTNIHFINSQKQEFFPAKDFY